VAGSEHPESAVLEAFGRGELPPGERVVVAEHLASCDTCCAALGQERSATIVVPSGDLHNTNAAPAVSDPNFASPEEFFNPKIPLPLANHPQYRILDQLGEGGMGVVYKAEHKVMDRVVALKLLAPHLTANPAAVDRFRQEVKAAGKLSHPNIVISHDAGEAGGLHFLVMEYVEGISLDRLVARRGPLAVTMACHFARQVAQGLQHACDKGMVHRDIKPQNLMVTRKGQVKILDFGLARLARDIETNGEPGKPRHAATAPNLIMGTPDYLSPEQAKNSSKVDIRADLYSLGCTLYFLLTGRPPFAKAATLIDKLLAHTEEQAAPIEATRPDVPDGLLQIVSKLMAKRPADRFSTPSEVAAALAPFAKGHDGSLAPTAPPAFEVVEAIVVPPSRNDFKFESRTEVEAETPEQPRAKKPSRKQARLAREKRNKLIGTIIGIVVVGLVIGGAVKLIRKLIPDEPEKIAAKNEPNSTPAPPPSKNPTPPPAVKTNARVLFVLPSFGLWMNDYLPVRRRLEAAGVRVSTATGPNRVSVTPNKESVDTDLTLTPTLDVSEFGAVIFVGRNTSEFARTEMRGGFYAAGSVISRFQNKNAVLAAISEGQAILAAHGALDGKAVAAHSPLRDLPAFSSRPIKWKDQAVLTDGKIVTASGPEHADAFADAILKALRD